ncbi:hypothetical protein [Stutzerimonas kunmingensis]|uniref:hypothetical protein n=1 Tax=Stutzerimonas kunmingensis TaxID=1211807 RepID=UPI0028B00527|nr:hypothetical protein [Stutzerimonas kunmingensis]
MPLYRVASASDYEPFDLAGKVMYRLPWETSFCPGNPCSDPHQGARDYNAYQAKAMGLDGETDPTDVFLRGLQWALASDSPEAIAFAREIIDSVETGKPIGLPVRPTWESQESLAYRTAASFLNDRLPALVSNYLTQLKIRASWNRNG